MKIVPGVKIANFTLGSPLFLLRNSSLLFNQDNILLIWGDLLFKFKNQILLEISIQLTHGSTLEIYNTKFQSHHVTIRQIYEIMGPISKGQVENQVYVLTYLDQGIKFIFKIPTQEIKREIASLSDLPFKLSDGSTLVLREIVIFSLKDTISSQIEIIDNKIHVKDVDLDFTKSLLEILREIGQPDLQYYKRCHICWVYSKLGLEIIKDLDSDEFRLVLHYNVPGHWDFSKFNKCAFKVKRGPIEFTDRTPFKEFRKLIKTHGRGSPLVVNKNKSGFGSTWSYAFSFGVIVQVSGSDQIISITLTKV